VAGYGGPLDDLLAALDDAPAAIIRAAADRFAELAHTEASRTPWRRMATRPERLVISGDSAGVRIVGTPAAVWAWAEAGIQPHTISRRSAARSRRGRRSSSATASRSRPVLNLTSGPVMGPVRHPGYRRLGAWTAATNNLEAAISDIAADALGGV